MIRKDISKENQRPGVFRFGDFTLDPDDRLLMRNQERVVVPPKAFDALLCLVSRPERLVTKRELMDALWPATHVADANLTNTIGTLRKILGHDSIQTVSKHGYRLLLRVEGEPGIAQETYKRFV